MGKSSKPKGKAFWSRVEDAGEAMEMGMRMILGFVFAILFASTVWWLGGQIWHGLGFILSMIAIPAGFVVRFFWLEVKFLLGIIRALLVSFLS